MMEPLKSIRDNMGLKRNYVNLYLESDSILRMAENLAFCPLRSGAYNQIPLLHFQPM